MQENNKNVSLKFNLIAFKSGLKKCLFSLVSVPY